VAKRDLELRRECSMEEVVYRHMDNIGGRGGFGRK